MQTPRTSNDLRSPHSVYSPASSIPQYQFPASPAYPARQNTSRGVVPTVTAANTPYQQSMAISHAPLDHHTNPMYRGSRPLPYARAPTAPSPVPYDVPPEIQEPTIRKKRKRADARQLEALNRMYARTAFPSTEERQQLARNLDMSARSVQIWLAHPLVHTSCIISDIPPFPSGSRTKGGRDVKEDTILPTLRSTRPL
jgi:homeobox protein YOX1/YHP1